jgi:hypothetical protein
MTRLLSILLGALLLPLSIACSDSGSPTAPASPIEDISDSEVVAASATPGLTDDQRAEIRAAYERARQRIAELRVRYQAGEVTDAEARAIVHQIHAELLAAIHAILGRPGPGQPPFLGLTQEQMAQIAALRQELAAYFREVQARVESGELTPEQGRAALREKAAQVHRRICAVLTPEQRGRAGFCPGG